MINNCKVMRAVLLILPANEADDVYFILILHHESPPSPSLVSLFHCSVALLTVVKLVCAS